MRVLTDTHTLVWALSKPEELSAAARRALETNPFTASVVNFWELVLKARNPSALMANPVPWWTEYVTGQRIPTLAITELHSRALAGLPEIHRDPFDRILAAQAISENLVLVSCDRALSQYGIPVVW